MAHQLVCPPRDLLESWVQGKESEPTLTELAQHVETCVACLEAARTLVSHDTLLDALRDPSPEADALSQAIPRPFVEKIKRLSSKTDHDAPETLAHPKESIVREDQADLDFLAPPELPDEIGALGGYRILKVLGKGGMGMVFLADDPELDRQVGLKVMLPSVAANPSAKQRFLREARTAAKIRSDYIVTIYRVSEDRGIPFLAMELLDGMPMDAYLQSGKKLTPTQILRVGGEIASGLAAAHEKGLIHRDIKPGNLWLDKANRERVKILDFGLARLQQDDIHLTQSGAIVGTPAYMAPEQARGDKGLDARADLFSLGCVLYRLVAGEIPFKSDSTMGVLLAIAMHTPTRPNLHNDQIPTELSDLIMQLLEKDPANRPATAKEVIGRIQQIEKNLVERKDVSLAASEPSVAKPSVGELTFTQPSAPPPEEPGFTTAMEQARRSPRSAERTMADQDFSTKRLLALRRLTRAFADVLRGQLKEFLGILALQFRSKPFLGEFVEGPKDYLKGADENFKTMKAAYEAVCKTRPFSLPAEIKTPMVLTSQVPEIHALDYVHEAKGADQTKKITVTAPLRFALTYSGFGPNRLKNLLSGQGLASDIQEFVLHTLIIQLVAGHQPILGKLLEAIRFPLSTAKIPGCGELPFCMLTAGVPTILPPDEVIIESTEISGTDVFEEVVDLGELAKLKDPFREKLVDLAKQHGETLA